MQTHYNFYAGGDVGRIEALSDGIFAFAATVLVLDFRTPSRRTFTRRPNFSAPCSLRRTGCCPGFSTC
jgi:uncharacterized membrane protein